MREFDVDGPFEVPIVPNGRTRCIDEDQLGGWWDDSVRADVGSKRGCYVFAMRQGRGALPVYVGMTSSQTFRSECFNARNLKELNKLLASRGRLVLFVLAPAGRGPTARATIKELELYLIGLAANRNGDLINRHGIPQPPWKINGIGGARGRGRPRRSTQELAQVLGVR